jgi:hypothetical protein
VGLCVTLGLYGKELVAIDGNTFKAVNSKDRTFTMTKMRERIARLEAHSEAYLGEVEDNDRKENSGNEKTAVEINRIVTELSERKERHET